MEKEGKINALSTLIENVLYRRLAITDEDDRTTYLEKQQIKKRLIKEFLNNIPEAYKDLENPKEIVKAVLTKMNQYVEWEDEKFEGDENLSAQIPKTQGKIDNKEDLEK